MINRLRRSEGYAVSLCKFLVATLALLLGMAGCSSGGPNFPASTTPLISVAMSQVPPTSLNVGNSAPVTATVTNDPANAGVDWVATCASAPNCGSFSPSHTASGATSVYTAPLGVPAHNTVTINALSATDHSKAITVSITIISTVSGITITQPPPATFPSGGTLTLAATVMGDPSNEGVDWKANCGGIDCTSSFPGGAHSPAGSSISFTVPLTSATFPMIVGSTVTITAFPTADHAFSAMATFVVSGQISISITQAPPSTVLTNTSVPVTAVVANDPTNAGVTWTVVSCDASPCGSWSASSTVLSTQVASGASITYVAPPTPVNHVVLQAAATAAPLTTVATVEISITAPISVAISQKIVNNTIVQNASAPLVATVTNDAANAGVDWTVSCGSSACGGFSAPHTASGVATTFTAPNAVPAGNSVTITATSTTDPTMTATQTVTVTSSVPPNSLLLGQFVILLTAKNSKNGPYAIGGIISGDGNGNITEASLDLTDASGNASTSVGVSPSTYSIGTDGRGQIDLLINTGTLNGNFGLNGAITLSVVFVSPHHALLSETDTFGTGTGTLDLQNIADLAAFQSGAWSNGTYALQLGGTEVAQPYPGYFVASAVRLDFSTSGYAYVADQSDNGAITSVPFTTTSSNLNITRSQNGEITFNSLNLGLFTRFNLDAWLIDATHFAVTDWRDSAFGSPPVILAGYLTAQPASPSITGTFAFTEAGATTTPQPQVAGGILTCGSSGTLDVIPLGGTAVTAAPITATCSAPDNGRSLIALSGTSTAGISQFAAYPTSDQGLYLLEIDGGSAGTSGPSGAGIALQQTLATPISSSAFTGNYASSFLASTALGSQNFAGQIVSDGVSAISGTADVSFFDTTAAPPTGTPSSGDALTGSFTAGTDGRFPLMLMLAPAAGQPTPEITILHPACYLVDASTCLLLGSDVTAPGTGILLLQQPDI